MIKTFLTVLIAFNIGMAYCAYQLHSPRGEVCYAAQIFMAGINTRGLIKEYIGV